MFQPIVSRAALRPIRHHRGAGFTPLEVMIVVAIVTILAAIAIPSYRDYILRGRLVDATNLLATFRGNMERCYQDKRTYLATGTFNPPCSAAIPAAQRRQGDSTTTSKSPLHGAYRYPIHVASDRQRNPRRLIRATRATSPAPSSRAATRSWTAATRASTTPPICRPASRSRSRAQAWR